MFTGKTGQRLRDYIAALGILVCLNFFLPRLMPGDPAMILTGSDVVVETGERELSELTSKLGLDRPLGIQFIHYLGQLACLELGFSRFHNAPVTDILARHGLWTLALVLVALGLSLVTGFIFGLEGAWHHGRFPDVTLTGAMMVLNSVPPYALAMFLLLFFGFHLNILPVSGGTTPFTQATGPALAKEILRHMVLPVLSLYLHVVASVCFIARNTAVTVMSRPFMRVGTAKGLRPFYLRFVYLGLNSAAPVLAKSGTFLANLLTGVLFVEVVFSYPGIGLVIHEAVMNHDYPVIQGGFLVMALLVLVVNFLVDVCLDSREQQC